MIARAVSQSADGSVGNLILKILQSTKSDEGLRISGFFVETSIVNEVEYCWIILSRPRALILNFHIKD